ncbi:hypothetical protein SO802_017407 [Lithocarpus litseifolius]|uniref:Oxidoreductase N-terminal domain-containing protein n=1 Tax=Lithocarpus litseifolius TaxID=425828 RepID=A0AAW2CM76_9ROSI
MEEVDNKQVIFKGYIERPPKETDMDINVSKIKLRAPKGSGAILVKNLYLSCDPFMRGRMRDFQGSYIPPFVPGQALEGFGVYKVIDSEKSDFKPGDLFSGLTGWEEYSLICRPQQFRKILPDNIPLSYHVGLLVFNNNHFVKSSELLILGNWLAHIMTNALLQKGHVKLIVHLIKHNTQSVFSEYVSEALVLCAVSMMR